MEKYEFNLVIIISKFVERSKYFSYYLTHVFFSNSRIVLAIAVFSSVDAVAGKLMGTYTFPSLDLGHFLSGMLIVSPKSLSTMSPSNKSGSKGSADAFTGVLKRSSFAVSKSEFVRNPLVSRSDAFNRIILD